MTKKGKEEKGKLIDRFFRILLLLAAGSVFVYSAGQLVTIFLEYRNGEDEYAELRETAEMDVTEKPEEISGNPGGDTEDTAFDGLKPENRNINFKQLKDMNTDIVGWIDFGNHVIDYPILQGEDNEYYLKRTFKKKENSSGSIFMDARSSEAFEDRNTFIYGHNMKNGAMFAGLNKYKEQKYLSQYPYFWIYTPSGVYQYEIFSCYVADEAGDSYVNSYASDGEFREYLSRIQQRSIYETGVRADIQDSIVSLSTCTKGDGTTRFLVHGKRMDQN